MKALILFAHPNPKSFNKAILDTITGELEKKGAEVRVKDLYAMNFNPVLSGADFEQLMSGKTPPDIAAEQSDVTWADTMIILFPVWWIGVPAILKGWIDRVFSYGFAYQVTDKGAEGLLKDKKALVLSTSGSDEETWGQAGVLEAIKTVLIKGSLGFSGITKANYQNFYSVPTVSDDDRKAMLEEVKNLINNL